MRLFDSHAHLDIGRRTDPAEARAMLARAWEAGLEGVLLIAGATRPGSQQETFDIAADDPRIWFGVGIHPHAASGASPDALEKQRLVLDRPRVVTLGEIGLDYHYNYSEPSEQRRAFVDQLRMAHAAELPIVVHTREADDDTLAILRDEGANELGGVIHCFSSGPALAEGALELGLHLSFSGIVTFPGAKEVQQVAADAPADRILAETDTPFLSPVPHRGKVNEPARVRHVVEEIAALRGAEPDEVGALTADNTRRCFGLPPAETEGAG